MSKNHKLLMITKEFENDSDRYNINGINLSKAKFFARKDSNMEEIPQGVYRLSKQNGVNFILFNDKKYLKDIERIQIVQEFASISSKYEVDFDIDINILADNYNKAVEDIQNLYKYIKTNVMVSDEQNVMKVLPNLKNDEVWIRTSDGYKGFNIKNFEADMRTILNSIESARANAIKDLESVGAKCSEELTKIGDSYIKQIPTDIAHAVRDVKNDLDDYAGVIEKSLVESFNGKKDEIDTHTNSKKSELDRHTLLNKEVIDKHTNVKKTALNEHTDKLMLDLNAHEKVNERMLDTHVEEVNKVEISKYIDSKKSSIDSYAKTKVDENVVIGKQTLNNYTNTECKVIVDEYIVTKKPDIDSAVNESIKPHIDKATEDIDAYIEVKKSDIDTHTVSKERELDKYVEDFKDIYSSELHRDLDAYVIDKESMMNNFVDSKKVELNSYVDNNSKGRLDSIIEEGVSKVGGAIDTELARVVEEGNKQVSSVQSTGNAEIEKIKSYGVDGLQPKHDDRLSTSAKDIVEAINEVNNKGIDPSLLESKADKSYVDSKLLVKADKSYVDKAVKNKVDGLYVSKAIADKADKSYVDSKVSSMVDKDYVDNALFDKADKSYVEFSVKDKASQYYVDTELSKKVSSTSLDSKLSYKADKSYVDTELSGKADSSVLNTIKSLQPKKDNKLNTSSNNIVEAINEVYRDKLDKKDNSLTTIDKTIVGAINEVSTKKQSKTDINLTTSSKDIVGSINELNSKVSVGGFSLFTSKFIGDRNTGDTSDGFNKIPDKGITYSFENMGSTGKAPDREGMWALTTLAIDENSYFQMAGGILKGGFHIRTSKRNTSSPGPWQKVWTNDPNSISKDITGFCQLPNGMIMQWGSVEYSHAGGDGRYVPDIKYPIEFNKLCYVGTNVPSYSSSWEQFTIINYSTNYATLRLNVSKKLSSNMTIQWFAFGY